MGGDIPKSKCQIKPYIVSPDNYRGYHLLAGDLMCGHWSGTEMDEAHRCYKKIVPGALTCREECNNLPSCKGYSEQASNSLCYIFTSDGVCPGWSEQPGKLVEHHTQLVADKNCNCPDYNCYKKSMNRLI